MSARPLLIVMPSLSCGGAERHSTWVATALDHSRWSAHVLAFADGPLRSVLEDAGVPVEVRALPVRRWAVPAAAAAVRLAVDRVRPALIMGHQILTETAVRLALREYQLPYLAWKHAYGHIGHRGFRERVFEQVTGGVVTRYGAVCHTQRRYLTGKLGLPADKISVVPNAVPAPAKPPGPPPPDSQTVLMPAAMRAYKDHALVLRTWPGVLAQYPSARLALVGDGPCRRDLEHLASELGVAGQVDFLGVRRDINLLLADAHLLVLASYTIECFPYAALEAMAAGRGVVSTDVGGLPELVDDGVTGRLVPPRDAVALTDALVEGLSDAISNVPRWGPAGWDRVRRVFPFDRWAERIADLFDDVASTPTRRVLTSLQGRLSQ